MATAQLDMIDLYRRALRLVHAEDAIRLHQSNRTRAAFARESRAFLEALRGVRRPALGCVRP